MELNLRPRPGVDSDTLPYWQGCRQHQLRIQQCESCRGLNHFPSRSCRHCGSRQLGWTTVSGRGRIYTYTVVHHIVTPGFPLDKPYVVAWIELVEDSRARVLSNIIGCPVADVRIGLEVEVEFVEIEHDVVLPLFRPVGAKT